MGMVSINIGCGLIQLVLGSWALVGPFSHTPGPAFGLIGLV